MLDLLKNFTIKHLTYAANGKSKFSTSAGERPEGTGARGLF